MNNSLTAGYLTPTTEALPGGLSLEDFIHGVIVGLTGLDKKLVRPRYQNDPTKQPPEPTINWCSFSFNVLTPDNNAYVEGGENDSSLQRNNDLQLFCSFYGNLGFEFASIFSDGFQITQNRDKLTQAKIGYTGVSQSTYVPELINNRWFPRTDITVFLKRQVTRKYNVESFLSAEGIIHGDTNLSTTIDIPINVEE